VAFLVTIPQWKHLFVEPLCSVHACILCCNQGFFYPQITNIVAAKKKLITISHRNVMQITLFISPPDDKLFQQTLRNIEMGISDFETLVSKCPLTRGKTPIYSSD
jgi:hypothetical protein